MNKVDLIAYLEKINGELKSPSTLHIYGSAAFMLLDEPDRTSLDIDVAAPYSVVDESDLRRAAALAGIPWLHRAWRELQKNPSAGEGELGELLDQAWLLHQALPEDGYSSQRALNRLALYQAKSRAFGMVTFLANLRKYCSRPEITTHVVPGNLVRDIGLPPLCREGRLPHKA